MFYRMGGGPISMNVLKLTKILIVPLVALTMISALATIYAYQLPTQQTQTITLCTYRHTGTYDYIAALKPNTIYNKTTLKAGEGTFYTAIVDYVNITFTYSFTSTPKPDNATTNHQITIQLESPEKWTKTLTAAEARETLQLTSDLNFTLQINCTKVAEFVKLIDKDTGTTSTTYNINVKPAIHLTSNAIDETFNPQLTVAFKQDATKGKYISIEPLTTTKPGQITETRQIPMPWVEKQRKISMIATVIAAVATTATSTLYIKNKPEKPRRKPMEKRIEPYKELMVESAQKSPETEATINLKTIEDLARTAEILAKPIIYNKEDENYRVYDNSITYEFKPVEAEENESGHE